MSNDTEETSRLLEETKEYYRQRAPQFTDWHRGTGRYESGFEFDQSFLDEAKILFAALKAEHLRGNVLEIASGTGVWTEAVIKTASALTALDSSEEMLKRCRARLGTNPKIKYVVADFYDWPPDQEYDVVTFSFMISHVPSSKLDEFALKISRCLGLGGKIFFVDQQTQGIKDEELDQPGGEVAWRTLESGRRFKVIKHFYTPKEIEESFLPHGIKVEISTTPSHFFLARGVKIR